MDVQQKNIEFKLLRRRVAGVGSFIKQLYIIIIVHIYLVICLDHSNNYVNNKTDVVSGM